MLMDIKMININIIFNVIQNLILLMIIFVVVFVVLSLWSVTVHTVTHHKSHGVVRDLPVKILMLQTIPLLYSK